MEYLTEKHISEITTLIKAKGVEMEELLYDLVDHTCCMVEEKMEQGKSYTSALDESMSSFGNNGIRNIQEETTYLLTKNILVMRKTMHIIGITSAILLLLGSIFKIQHWPGAAVIYILGGALLCFVFMPLFLSVKIKEKLGKFRTWLNIVGIASAFLVANGIFFKLMHWPYANVLMDVGGAILFFVYLPLAIYSFYKNKELRSGTLTTLILAISGFSILFALVSLRSSFTVRSSIINMQYTINSNIKNAQQSNNQLLLLLESDSLKDYGDIVKANEIAESINNLTAELSFEIAKSEHADLSDETIKQILASNYLEISDDNGNLNVLRKQENGLNDLLILIDEYHQTYSHLLGVDAQVDVNDENVKIYFDKKINKFPLGIIIHDLSILNLQVQRLHTSLLQHYKGRVS